MRKIVDLRSDTVTQPGTAMRKAMNEAAVGDDVLGEDPTITCLEEATAEMFNMESGLFVASGTQGNLLALFSHCQRGDEYIAGQAAHNYLEEGGGGAILASIQPQPIPNEVNGTLSLGRVRDLIKPDDFHYARTRLLCLENTWHGRPLPLDYLDDARNLTRVHKLALHLDGARVFNAAVRQQVEVSSITSHFDSISACLSKGLGAPVGSVLCGSRNVIDNARRWRKVLGGGWRQAGVLAAAGLYALEHHIERLATDHYHATLLAKSLAEIEELSVDNFPERTNMVWVEVPEWSRTDLAPSLRKEGVLISMDDYPLRLVTHLDINEADIRTATHTFKKFFSKKKSV
jgi:threonine aldolase